ncbi:MAG TPA: DoxX family protein [Sphingobium sp.]|uniref:DoxX family protein n=1 Tax=Sphingobium sp. TaxID=1912891 RepID=UPI002ED33941
MTASENPRWMTLTGRTLSLIVILFLLMDAGMKLPPLSVVGETMTTLGWPADANTARLLGVLTLVPTLLYIWPRTAVLGAILMTAYLGGAVATHVRLANPLFTHILFGVYLGLFLWGGLWFRSPALRALMPVKS